MNNSWALFQDDDPATSLDASLLFEVMADKADCSDLDPDGDGQIPTTGGKLLKGNGDSDDNKQEPLSIVRRAVVTITPNQSSASVKICEHRSTSSYLDFGHLKVFPDAPMSVIIAEKLKI